MFPKITNYIELLSEDEVWDAVKNGKEINVLILEDISDYLWFRTSGLKTSKYDAGYIKGISNINKLRTLINMRKAGLPIIFIIWNKSITEESKEEESNGESN